MGEKILAVQQLRLLLLLCGAATVGVAWGQSRPAPARPAGRLSKAVPLPVLGACHGEKKPLTILSQMPYVLAKVGAAEGYFLLDFASAGPTGSTIDPTRFRNGVVPQSVAGTPDQFADFDFYGSWGTVRLQVKNHGDITLGGGQQQAGIIGTNFLALNAYTLDYANGAVYRAAPNTLCPDAVLRAEGFRPVSTLGYFAADGRKVQTGFPVVPTVPVRLGRATAVAQLDTGFDDKEYHSININRAFFTALKWAGVPIEETTDSAPPLSTCVPGFSEKTIRCRLGSGYAFEIIGTDGTPVVSTTSVAIFLKESPPEAQACGGIGTWQVPAAQLGASFFTEAQRLIFDPASSRVWFGAAQPR